MKVATMLGEHENYAAGHAIDAAEIGDVCAHGIMPADFEIVIQLGGGRHLLRDAITTVSFNLAELESLVADARTRYTMILARSPNAG